jgi:hypothetical protein
MCSRDCFFRLGFLAAVFLVALRAMAGFVFVLVDRLVVKLFFLLVQRPTSPLALSF